MGSSCPVRIPPRQQSAGLSFLMCTCGISSCLTLSSPGNESALSSRTLCRQVLPGALNLRSPELLPSALAVCSQPELSCHGFCLACSHQIFDFEQGPWSDLKHLLNVFHLFGGGGDGGRCGEGGHGCREGEMDLRCYPF